VNFTLEAITGDSAAFFVDGPEAGNTALRVPAGSYLKMNYNIPANGGGSNINQYTLMMDVKLPVENVWYTLLQTDKNNSSDNDAEVYINNGTIGAYGNYGGSISVNEWHRVVISVKNGEWLRYYLDGLLIYDAPKPDVDGVYSLSTEGLVLFADGWGGYDHELDVAEIAFWNGALSAADIAALSNVTPEEPEEPEQPEQPKPELDAEAITALLSDGATLAPAVTAITLSPVNGTTGVSLVAGPTGENTALRMPKGSYLTMDYSIEANGGGSYGNLYSIMMDVKLPASGKWYALYQTDTGNGNDADAYVNENDLIGTAADYEGAVSIGDWHRVVITVNTAEKLSFYVDGMLLNEVTNSIGVDGNYALYLDQLLLFADGDGYDDTLDVSEVAFWNSVLTAEQVTALGGVPTE
jgi:hypothetical protein